jgi:hypothetical protein
MPTPNAFRFAPVPEDPDPAGVAFSPEQRLLLSVLLQAIRDAASASPYQRQEARAWLLRSAECAEICQWLDLPHDRLQQFYRQDGRDR